MDENFYQHLLEFITDKRKMRMAHIYQPVMLMTLLGARSNQFYSDHGGSGMETKELEIGGMKYSGVGYRSDLWAKISE